MASDSKSSSTERNWSMPHDRQEFQRLDRQHEAVRLVFNGLYPCKETVKEVMNLTDGQPKRILDLGSGSGVWCVEMAREFPDAEVLGLDIVPNKLDSVPSNCSFATWDLNDGLSQHHGRFNIVHARFIGHGLTDHHSSLLDFEQCLKPGGLLILIAAYYGILKEEGDKIWPPLTSNNPEGSWLQRFISFWPLETRSSGFNPELIQEDCDHGLWEHELYDRSTCRAALMRIPIGTWATSPDPQESARLKKMGELWRDNFMALNQIPEKLLSRCGRSLKDIEVLQRNLDQELLSGQKISSSPIMVLWGRRRMGEGVQVHKQEGDRETKRDKDTGFQVLTIFDDPDEWRRVVSQIDSTTTAESTSLKHIPGFDMLESW